MAIASSPSAPSFCCTARAWAAGQRHSLRPISWRPGTSFPTRVVARTAVVSQLQPPFDDGKVPYEPDFKWHRHRSRGMFPVYVTLPDDTVDTASQEMRRKRAMAQSFRALALAGVEGVVMEVWWGLVERESPCTYNWHGYLEVVEMAARFGLKVRAVMAFHQRGSDPHDPLWIPLPEWVLQEMDIDPGLAFSDKHGTRSKEYISLGCDTLPVLHGRTPVQAYGDFMRNFKETFGSFLGGVITGVQVGLGPNGELRYPSCPSEMLSCSWRKRREFGHFQCYDKYMIASMNVNAHWMGERGWGYTGPMGTTTTSSELPDLDTSEFYKSDGSWGTVYGDFFLKWYSSMLLLHGERICREAEKIFQENQIEMLGKLGSVHWHYTSLSHPSQLTCGYYNTAFRDGFGPFMRMFSRHNFSVCCSCFELEDHKVKKAERTSSPESYVKQVVRSAGFCDVPISGENFSGNIDDDSFKQVIKMVKYYCDGVKEPSLSFNFVRMDKSLFEPRNWVSFARFVKLMSTEANFDFGGDGNRGGGGGAGNTTSPLAVATFGDAYY